MRTIYHLTLTAAVILSGTLAAIADDSLAKKFKISVTGGFDYSASKISASSSLITDTDGEVMSDLKLDDNELKAQNESNSYRLEQQFVDLRAEYEYLPGATVWCGVGVVTTSMRNSYKDSETLLTKSASENPTFLLKGGLSYRFDFKGGYFVSVSANVAWNKSDNNLLSFHQNDVSAIYYAYEMDRDVLRWEVPLVGGYRIGRWTPYAGVSYADYRISDNFRSTVSYVGKDYPITIKDTYRSCSKINGIVGCTYSIADNLGVRLHGSFSRNIAATLSLFFTI